jgi:hypothetical protein
MRKNHPPYRAIQINKISIDYALIMDLIGSNGDDDVNEDLPPEEHPETVTCLPAKKSLSYSPEQLMMSPCMLSQYNRT